MESANINETGNRFLQGVERQIEQTGKQSDYGKQWFIGKLNKSIAIVQENKKIRKLYINL